MKNPKFRIFFIFGQMLSELTKNNLSTSEKTLPNEYSKEISGSDDFKIFSKFSKNLKNTQAQADSTTSGDESGIVEPNYTQISQNNKEQTSRNMPSPLKLIIDEPMTEKNETNADYKLGNLSIFNSDIPTMINDLEWTRNLSTTCDPFEPTSSQVNWSKKSMQTEEKNSEIKVKTQRMNDWQEEEDDEQETESTKLPVRVVHLIVRD